ncbi:hypothetical protein HNQ88_003727 [Aureibacter tunicatorum]|uniref:Uncharacterized protein n=1 Tax=Aureibacter tunicatorum TaxID=866807 RepID=A0AAE3XMI7_9BACT|nr:hypothetical protein [Aureibacter tunicatorum]BDD06488.1 hypothetical protein AUTU_39710 [Aureibacter tunicatorum]
MTELSNKEITTIAGGALPIFIAGVIFGLRISKVI